MAVDEGQHLLFSQLKENNTLIKTLTLKVDETNSILKELVMLQREQLNFFVALDRREMGMEDTSSAEYLTELRKDNFTPTAD